MLRCLLTFVAVAVTSAATESWRFDANGSMGTPVAGPNGAVYVLTGEMVSIGNETLLAPFLHAFNNDGTTRWTWELPGGQEAIVDVRQRIVIRNDGTVYLRGGVSTGRGRQQDFLYSIRPNGKLGWMFRMKTYSFASASIGKDGTVYQPSEFDFYAVHPNGTLRWNFSLSPSVSRSPAVVGNDGTIYVSLLNDRLIALNPDGTQKWTFNAPGEMFTSSSTIGEGGVLYVGSEGYPINGTFGTVFAVNPDGSLKWRFNHGVIGDGCVVRDPVTLGQDNTVYFNCDSTLYAVYKNGTQAWKSSEAGSFEGSPSVGPDGTVYTKRNGQIIALASDGTKREYSPWQSVQEADASLLHSTATVGMPRASGDAVLFGKRGEIYASHDKGVVALASDMSVIWHFDTFNLTRDIKRYIKQPHGIAVGQDGTLFLSSHLSQPQRNLNYSRLSAVRGDAHAGSTTVVQQALLI